MKIGFFEITQEEEDYIKSKLIGHELIFHRNLLDVHSLSENNYDVVSIFTGSVIDEELLKNFSNVKMIATRTTGFDHIDYKKAAENNIAVCNVPTYGENTVAEYTFGLLLNLTRKIHKAYQQVKTAGSFSLDGLKGMDLQGKTLGILGTGRIGQHVIRIANGFEMKVVAYDINPQPELEDKLNFKYIKLEELLKSSDVISIHVPYLPETQHLINQQNLNLIKKGCILINTARGGVVETQALIQGLEAGVFGGAGLDVLEEEGPLKDELNLLQAGHPKKDELRVILQNHALINMDNVIITPHNAFNTNEAVHRILDTTIENIVSFIAGNPKNILN